MFAEQHKVGGKVEEALNGVEAVYQRQASLSVQVRELDRKTMWYVVGLSVLTGGGLVFAGKKAASADAMAFRAAKSARGVREELNNIDSKLDKTNARMDALNDKVSYGFKTVLGVGEPKH